MSLDFGLKEFGVMDEKERLQRYRRFVYKTGTVNSRKDVEIDQKIVEEERRRKRI